MRLEEEGLVDVFPQYATVVSRVDVRLAMDEDSITLEVADGAKHKGKATPMELLDLPGSYSLQVRSPDEAVSRDVLLGRVPGACGSRCRRTSRAA